ncbi:dihydropteroate synthase [Thiomicrorhabdus indica]|uniref:dihydropteroate synthase n=1 Tax=Thiomicrorhabdus indica TaxID=2267253 RepID=UPI001F0DA34B|nr:dihydropteroate synthase [Thiomicrorhabdus indica]
MELHAWLERVVESRKRAAVMGILNVTPDSFSDGGDHVDTERLRRSVERMVMDGVDVFDIGGESTRPGSEPVSLQQELDRVIPAIELVKELSGLPISIDTYKPQVMKEAIECGASIINDVNALQEDNALEIAASLDVPVCLMHKKGLPKTMQQQVEYDSVLDDVESFLMNRVNACIDAGIRQEQIMLDPGFGFGKLLTHNQNIFQNLDRLFDSSYPLLVGVSRKKMIGELLEFSDQKTAKERVYGSVGAAVVAAIKGAKILRVHDVKQTVEALKVAQALW